MEQARDNNNNKKNIKDVGVSIGREISFVRNNLK